MNLSVVSFVFFALFALAGAAFIDLGNMPNLADACTGISIVCFFISLGSAIAGNPRKG